MQIGTIKEIWRYPVKSLGGHLADSALVEARGIASDRCWSVRDEQTGEIVGGRKIPGLMMLGARYLETASQRFDEPVDGELEIEFPDGQTVRSDDPYASAMLSMYLGRRVSLIRRPTRKQKDAYKLAKPMTPAEVRYALGMKPDDPDPNFSSFSLSMLTTLARYATPPGVLYDVYPLHILTTSALQWIGQFYPQADFSVRRYRPNFLIQTDPGLEGIIENDWRGRELQIGPLRIFCNHPTIRCSMPGAAQPGLPKDPNIPLTLMKHAGQHLGAYATPLNQAEIKVGDTVELLPKAQGKLYSWLDEVGRRTKAKVLEANNWAGNLLDKGKKTADAVPAGFMPLTVARLSQESKDVVSIWLENPDKTPLPRFMPGQHLVLAIPGENGTPTYRPYSISSGSNQLGQYRLSVKLKSEADRDTQNSRVILKPQSIGQVSGFLHHRLKVGDRLLAKSPNGQFAIRPSDTTPLVLISSGIGITPFVSMLTTLAEENPSRKVFLHHGIRSQNNFPFEAELESLQKTMPNLFVQIWVSQLQSGMVDAGYRQGRLQLDALLDPIKPNAEFKFMVCGTPEFSQSVREGLLARHIGPGQIHSESFGAPVKRTTAEVAEYQVSFSQSRQTLRWSASEESLLSLAEAQGIQVSSGCRYGACQACEATLISGEVSYPEGVQPPAGKNRILLCSARPASDLEISL